MDKRKCSVCKNIVRLFLAGPETEDHTERVCQNAKDGRSATPPYRLCA
jgi:hypothetical protein